VCGLALLASAPILRAAAQRSRESGLKGLSLEQLGDIEVTTVSKEPEDVWKTPVAISVLTQVDIRRSGATTIPDLLRTIPGVEVGESESSEWSIGIRGFESSFTKGVLLLIDGRSAYTPLFEGVYWDVQDVVLQDVERIEVIRGPGGTIWGANAVNGVINIITKHAKDTQGVLATGLAGTEDRFNGAVREGFKTREGLQFRFFAKGFYRAPEKDPNHDLYDEWHMAHGGFRADWSPNERDSVTASGDLYTGRAGVQNALGQYVPLAQIFVDGNQDFSGGNINFSWKHSYAKDSDFHIQAYFDRTTRQTPQFGETRNTIDVDFIDHIAFLPRQDLIFGAGVRLSPTGIVQSQPTVSFGRPSQTDYIYSSFVQDAFRLVPRRLTLTLGTKLEDNNYSGFEVQPSARMIWNPAEHSALWGAISRAVRTPGRLDQDLQLTGVAATDPAFLVRVEGDPKFKSEVQIDYEAGYRQLLLHRVYVDLAAFHDQYDNLQGYGTLSFSNITTPISALVLNVPYANGIKGTTDGLEIAPDWKPARWWELKGNFSHVHIDLRPKAGFNDTGTVASYEGSSPHREATIQSLFNLPHAIELDVDYRFVSRLPAGNIKSYQTADFHAGWSLHNHLALSIAGRNLLQPVHEENTGDNGNPVGIRRSLYGGITWTR
jgi:iron complex outermembrane recepter protein